MHLNTKTTMHSSPWIGASDDMATSAYAKQNKAWLYWDIRLHTLCVQIGITKDSRLRTSCHLVVFTIRCLNRIFYKLITITKLLFFIKTQMKTWTVLRVFNTEFVKQWLWEKNMSGGILRSVLVFLLENHFVRFVVTLLMSCAYDTYTYGKGSLQNHII